MIIREGYEDRSIKMLRKVALMLAILTTHPIQYQVPLWQALARDGRVPFEVWYLTDHGTRRSRDREFGQTFAWDIDTLSGYTHRLPASRRSGHSL